jgi:hypothetical protein
MNLNTSLRKFARRHSRGEIGIEVELEGDLFLPTRPMSHWQQVEEGSLRHGGIELVMVNPVGIDLLPAVLQELFDILQKSTIKPSIRTSVHIHFNVLKWQVRDLYKLLMIYWLFENVLVRMHGKYREGNLHCLRLCDAHGIFKSLLTDLINGTHFQEQSAHGRRYSALNLASLPKFGSIEYRFLALPAQLSDITKWIYWMYHFSRRALSTPLEDLNTLWELPIEDLYLKYFDAEFLEEAITVCGRRYMEEARALHLDSIQIMLTKLMIADSFDVSRTEENLDLDPAVLISDVPFDEFIQIPLQNIITFTDLVDWAWETVDNIIAHVGRPDLVFDIPIPRSTGAIHRELVDRLTHRYGHPLNNDEGDLVFAIAIQYAYYYELSLDPAFGLNLPAPPEWHEEEPELEEEPEEELEEEPEEE